MKVGVQESFCFVCSDKRLSHKRFSIKKKNHERRKNGRKIVRLKVNTKN